MAENPTKANLIAKILFIVGGIILFILLAIFIIRIVPVAISGISNIGSNISNALKGDEEIVVSTNSDSINADSPLVVNFEYVPTLPGQYYVTYSCYEGLFFDIQSSNGPKRIICNTPFKLGENLSAISLVPVVTKSNIFIDSTITIQYKDMDGNPIADGNKIVTIKSETATESTTSDEENPFSADGTLSGSTVTTSSVTTKTNTEPKTVDAGFGIKYTSGGSSSGYTPTTSTSYTGTKSKDLVITEIYKLDNQSAFVFHVYNQGNTSSGTWEFSYTDAENPSKTLISPVQAPLAGGQGLAVTVRFDGQTNSNQLISIHVDPYNYISESSESNNKSSVTITGNRNGNSNSQDDSYDSRDDADLVITQMQVGKMSGSRFIEDDEIDSDDTAAVRFIVKNQGGESTGSWKFEIDNLPFTNDDSYRSKSYSSLRPGQSLEVITEFDGIDTGDYTLRIEVDSDDDVDEENERNNTESDTLEVNR